MSGWSAVGVRSGLRSLLREVMQGSDNVERLKAWAVLSIRRQLDI